ncbi:MAG: hypothetical protein K0R67_3479 [Paenibacillus sp.]|nr:hypothetical protein [Paenibacillus sp.]
MQTDFLRDWLVDKYEELEQRTLKAIEQLNETQLNWLPNESSNSIANLIVHIRGNIVERVSTGILHKELVRDRESEFDQMHVGKDELISLWRDTLAELISTTRAMTPEQFVETQQVRNKTRTHADVLLQVATHISEHAGQMLYIAKICLDDGYKTTTIPKRK